MNNNPYLNDLSMVDAIRLQILIRKQLPEDAKYDFTVEQYAVRGPDDKYNRTKNEVIILFEQDFEMADHRLVSNIGMKRVDDEKFKYCKQDDNTICFSPLVPGPQWIVYVPWDKWPI